MNTKLEIAKIVQEEFTAIPGFWEIKSHKRRISYPKKALCYVLRHCTSDTLVEIADFMGYADHSTVIYHSEDCEGMMKVYDDYNMKIAIVIRKSRDLIKEVTENQAV